MAFGMFRAPKMPSQSLLDEREARQGQVGQRPVLRGCAIGKTNPEQLLFDGLMNAARAARETGKPVMAAFQILGCRVTVEPSE